MHMALEWDKLQLVIRLEMEPPTPPLLPLRDPLILIQWVISKPQLQRVEKDQSLPSKLSPWALQQVMHLDI